MNRYVAVVVAAGVLFGCGGQAGGRAPGDGAPPGTGDGGTPLPVAPDAGTGGPGGGPDGGTDGGLTAAKPRWPDIQTSLPEYELTIPRIADLCANVSNLKYSVPGTFTSNGQSYPVEVRFRGRHTRYLAKRPFQVKFPKGVKFDGRDQLELLASWKDGGHLTEKMWFDLAASFGVPVSSAKYVVLSYDDCDGTRKRGVYTDLESVKKEFLARHGFHKDSDIYRCGMHDCEMRDQQRGEHWMEAWRKRTNKTEPWDNLWEFLRTVNRTPPDEFRQRLEQVMDVEALLAWMAVDAAISNDVVQDSRSFVIFDKRLRQWSYVPWDLNNSVAVYNRMRDNPRQSVTGRASRPLFNFSIYDWNALNGPDYQDRLRMYPDMKPAWSVLFTRVLDDEQLRRRFHAKLKLLLDTRFRTEEICPRAEAQARLLAPIQLEEAKQTACQLGHGTSHCEAVRTLVNPEFIAPVSPGDPRPRSVEFICRFVAERRRFLLSRLDPIAQHGRTALRINAAGQRADGTVVVEVVNSSAVHVSLEGLRLSGDLRRMTQSTLPTRTLAPGEVLVLTSQPSGTEVALQATVDLERPEVGLFNAGGTEAIDVLYLPKLSPGVVYRRASPSGESWERRDR